MRVLVNTPDLTAEGGVANYFQVLRPHFGPDVEYFTVGMRQHNSGRLRNLWRMVADYWCYSHKLIKGGFDLVHLNASLGSKSVLRDAVFLLLAKAFRKKVLVFVHGWDLSLENRIEHGFLFLFRLTYFRTDAFVVLASAFKETLQRWGYSRTVFLETTLVNDRDFSCGEPTAGFPLSILFLSRVEKEKGVYVVLEAFRTLKKRHPALHLIFAGDGSELPAVRAYVQNHDIRDVDFTGYVRGEEKMACFMRSAVFVFPTFGEGMPTCVLEAMACGLPVVTRPVGGLADFFEDGKMGFLTTSLSPGDFVPLLERLVVEPELRAQIGAYNLAYADEHFRASRVAQRLLAIYHSVCEHDGAAR